LSAFLGAFASISLNNYAERLRKQEIVKSTLASVVIEASLNLGILKTIQPVLLQTGPYIPFYRLSDSILKNALSNTDFSESRTVADKVILSMILGECGVINNQLDGMTYNSFSVKDENKKNLETVAESLEKKLNLILKKYPRPSWGNKAELDWLGEGGIIFTK